MCCIEDDTISLRAISAWGIEPQLDMCIEECAELIQAISKIKRIKYLNPDNPDHALIVQKRLANIKKELADVQLMINQLSTIYDFALELERVKRELKEKLKNE